jgi:AcrR family transcriptional regulator
VEANRRASRREAIVEATIRVIGAKGYRATTVGHLIAEAGVARTTFYKYFDDKHECFLAAYDLAAERALAAIAVGCRGERPWPERVRGGLDSLLELFVAEPELARTVVVEASVAGAGARRRQWAATAQVARLLESNRGRPDAEVPVSTGPMAVGAATALLFDEIQAGRTTTLRKRLPDLLFALLVPYLGPARATEAAADPSGVAVSDQAASR